MLIAALYCGLNALNRLFLFYRQVYEAYKSGKVDEAMSVGFILFLLCGDMGNLAGCYLTRQLPIQVGNKDKSIYLLFYLFTQRNCGSTSLYFLIPFRQQHVHVGLVTMVVLVEACHSLLSGIVKCLNVKPFMSYLVKVIIVFVDHV